MNIAEINDERWNSIKGKLHLWNFTKTLKDRVFILEDTILSRHLTRYGQIVFAWPTIQLSDTLTHNSRNGVVSDEYKKIIDRNATFIASDLFSTELKLHLEENGLIDESDDSLGDIVLYHHKGTRGVEVYLKCHERWNPFNPIDVSKIENKHDLEIVKRLLSRSGRVTSNSLFGAIAKPTSNLFYKEAPEIGTNPNGVIVKQGEVLGVITAGIHHQSVCTYYKANHDIAIGEVHTQSKDRLYVITNTKSQWSTKPIAVDEFHDTLIQFGLAEKYHVDVRLSISV